jgi:hypothetical protein
MSTPKPVPGTFNQYPVLVDPLPRLVRRQRRLEAKVAAIAQEIKDEKATREQIDELLVAAGLTKGALVTCLGYDVKHNERNGQSSLDGQVLAALLEAGGVDPEFVEYCVCEATTVGRPAKFATVSPSKGAKVRT